MLDQKVVYQSAIDGGQLDGAVLFTTQHTDPVIWNRKYTNIVNTHALSTETEARKWNYGV